MVRVSAIVLLMYNFLRRHTNRVSLHSDEDWYILRVHAHDMPHVDVPELEITVHKVLLHCVLSPQFGLFLQSMFPLQFELL